MCQDSYWNFEHPLRVKIFFKCSDYKWLAKTDHSRLSQPFRTASVPDRSTSGEQDIPESGRWNERKKKREWRSGQCYECYRSSLLENSTKCEVFLLNVGHSFTVLIILNWDERR